jgi:hypothetical protein
MQCCCTRTRTANRDSLSAFLRNGLLPRPGCIETAHSFSLFPSATELLLVRSSMCIFLRDSSSPPQLRLRTDQSLVSIVKSIYRRCRHRLNFPLHHLVALKWGLHQSRGSWLLCALLKIESLPLPSCSQCLLDWMGRPAREEALLRTSSLARRA